MEGNIRYFSEFLRGGTQFIIPVYQRNYDWKKENCNQLIDDLIMLAEDDKQTHFFGSLVVKPGDFSQDIVIIDGQQRLTTISLLLLAINHWMTEHKMTEVSFDPSYILNAFLMHVGRRRDQDTLKLQLNPRDHVAYEKLYQSAEMYDFKSNITINYQYLYNQLDELPISVNELMDSLDKLEVMVVNLNSPNDDPQLIFESLNSTGLDLTDADKIRNLLLMNENPNKQRHLFEQYWEPLETRTQFKLTNFFRDYLTIKLGRTPVISKVYDTFKEFYQRSTLDKTALFEEITSYSFAYEQILTANTNNELINNILYRFNAIQVTVIRPFVMAVLKDFNHNQVSMVDVVDVLSTIESYIARRMITKVPSNSLNKIMAVLYRDMKRLLTRTNQPANSYVEAISSILLTKVNTGEFPTDEQVVEAFQTQDFYKINSQFRTYLFERLENHDHAEKLNIFEGINHKIYSVEHIMPQKLTPEWAEMLGPNNREVYKNYIHSIGNLTLTGYNSKYSNKPFKQKQMMEKGFKESHFINLNKIPAEVDQWGETEILARIDQLTDIALTTWPYPRTEYMLNVNDRDMIIFDGTQEFTGYKILGFAFQTETYIAVDTWKEFFIQVVKTVAQSNPGLLYQFTSTNGATAIDSVLFTVIGTDRSEILPELFLFTAIANERKFMVIKELFDLYQIDYSELQIHAENRES